jgi:hypothetical protein
VLLYGVSREGHDHAHINYICCLDVVLVFFGGAGFVLRDGSAINKLTIKVSDPSRAPLLEASVHVLQWRPVSSAKSQLVDIKTGTPDAKGIFNVSLPPGQYTVYVASRAFCSRIIDIYMHPGRDRTYEFSLAVQTGDGFEVESAAPLAH